MTTFQECSRRKVRIARTYGKSGRIGHKALDLFIQFVLLLRVQSEHGERETESMGCRLRSSMGDIERQSRLKVRTQVTDLVALFIGRIYQQGMHMGEGLR